ncbi:MAG: hypothetical protein UX91_C0005G0092 [Candidatus Amesbacteria bacterium GW2011_GWB1_47_19]|nr:MAG: hypothetical protein UW51_C0007G0092 [Candidatus Amesbacteria bacterium GW2011_GWA1_44_24]KKU31174.1 MAG: hypothetical protein UX46_C0007G0092 [Candidatus Amesbacteria bacterium GW2011_GWC1_46_24]KKU67295.1 MAG: hypothetical protein UX91_C0005G0092 [Candidatus Amesbacteria bacterium GW2011_GWB1_47_19]
MVGIYTHSTGNYILKTVRSILDSQGMSEFKLMIVADGTPLDAESIRQLKKWKVIYKYNPIPSSINLKQKQIIASCKEKYLILTQDDVIFMPDTIRYIMSEFLKNSEVTFIGVKNVPLKGNSFLADCINIGTFLTNRIAEAWRNGDNYLSVIGRLEAFPTAWIKKMRLKEGAVSSDANYYFENKRMGGKYLCLRNTGIFFRNPQNLTEQRAKSSRFLHSRREMHHYNRYFDLKREYTIPVNIILNSGLKEFLTDPIHFIGYTLIFCYTRIFRFPHNYSLKAVWKPDISTKQLTSDQV